MIYGSSTDPVLIKKISLKIWTLRDELESVLNDRIAAGESKPNIEDLLLEYQSDGIANDSTAEVAEIKAAEDLDDFGEDEMAKALAAAEAGEEEQTEEENSPDDASQSQADIDALMAGGEETQSQGDIDALFAGDTSGEITAKRELTTKPEEKNGKLILKQRLPVIPIDKLYDGRAILAEVYMDHMYLFSSQPFLVGQSIVLEFRVPKKFVMNAQVVFCRTFNMKSRVISKNNLPYRVGVKFTYLKDGERTLLRSFVQSIEPTVQKVDSPQKAPSSGADEFDVFDELD